MKEADFIEGHHSIFGIKKNETFKKNKEHFEMGKEKENILFNSVRTYYGSKIITEESVRKEISQLRQKENKIEENKQKLSLNVNDKQ